jgi:hypothetical protein
MATFEGGQTVKGGYFLNTREWKLEMVEAPTGTLPGDGTAVYRRVPLAAMLVLAPLTGLAFVLLLPFIGLAVMGEFAVRKVLAALGRRAHETRPTTIPPR